MGLQIFERLRQIREVDGRQVVRRMDGSSINVPMDKGGQGCDGKDSMGCSI
jgi:hypothetical protein